MHTCLGLEENMLYNNVQKAAIKVHSDVGWLATNGVLGLGRTCFVPLGRSSHGDVLSYITFMRCTTVASHRLKRCRASCEAQERRVYEELVVQSAAVLWNLHRLRRGDEISVQMYDAVSWLISFAVPVTSYAVDGGFAMLELNFILIFSFIVGL